MPGLLILCVQPSDTPQAAERCQVTPNKPMENHSKAQMPSFPSKMRHADDHPNSQSTSLLLMVTCGDSAVNTASAQRVLPACCCHQWQPVNAGMATPTVGPTTPQERRRAEEAGAQLQKHWAHQHPDASAVQRRTAHSSTHIKLVCSTPEEATMLSTQTRVHVSVLCLLKLASTATAAVESPLA